MVIEYQDLTKQWQEAVLHGPAQAAQPLSQKLDNVQHLDLPEMEV